MSKPGREALDALLERRDLTEEAAYELMVSLTDPTMAPAMTGALLAALRIKGATAAEVRGFARAMRSLARQPGITAGAPVADVVGTGGDGSQSLNLSTGAALLAAACGVRIAKHGNRSVSSRCGSADVLEALGLPLPLDEHAAGACLDRTGFTFLFAPHYHPAMKHIAPVRQALGVRTVFNVLGPLANPANTRRQLLGVYSDTLVRPVAEVLKLLGSERAWVVHGRDGLDELTVYDKTHVAELARGAVGEFEIDPADLGLAHTDRGPIAGGTPAENAVRIRAIFGGEPGAARDIVLLNTAAALVVAETARNVEEGIEMARKAIDSGGAAAKLEELAQFRA